MIYKKLYKKLKPMIYKKLFNLPGKPVTFHLGCRLLRHADKQEHKETAQVEWWYSKTSNTLLGAPAILATRIGGCIVCHDHRLWT